MTINQRKAGKIVGIIIAVLLLVTIIGSTFFAYRAFFCPFQKKDISLHTDIYIDRDDNIDSVRVQLTDRCLPLQMWGFNFLAKHMKYENRICTGYYQITDSMTTIDVVRLLRSGNQTPVNITIPSSRTLHALVGKTCKNILLDSAELLKHLEDSAFCEKWGYNPATITCLIIPNTYEVYWDMTIEDFMHRMKRENLQFWNEQRMNKAKNHQLSPNEVIILASIVDQETNDNQEKPTIAGMYLNRLRIGMKLQADPTVKFALKDFKLKRILYKHLEHDSPYNTYLYKGLPPGPIAIPSKSSIEAVLNAEKNEYLYMCAKEDFSGSHNFAKTLTEHMRNARKYASALNERGIK